MAEESEELEEKKEEIAQAPDPTGAVVEPASEPPESESDPLDDKKDDDDTPITRGEFRKWQQKHQTGEPQLTRVKEMRVVIKSNPPDPQPTLITPPPKKSKRQLPARRRLKLF